MPKELTLKLQSHKDAVDKFKQALHKFLGRAGSVKVVQLEFSIEEAVDQLLKELGIPGAGPEATIGTSHSHLQLDLPEQIAAAVAKEPKPGDPLPPIAGSNQAGIDDATHVASPLDDENQSHSSASSKRHGRT